MILLIKGRPLGSERVKDSSFRSNWLHVVSGQPGEAEHWASENMITAPASNRIKVSTKGPLDFNHLWRQGCLPVCKIYVYNYES